MVHQPTSAQAYNDALESGKIQGKRRLVARAFATLGPGTSAEVLTSGGLGKNLNLMRARVTELADDGFLEETGTRKCEITGRQAIVWKFVGAGGKPRAKYQPHAELLEAKVLLARLLANEDDAPNLAKLRTDVVAFLG